MQTAKRLQATALLRTTLRQLPLLATLLLILPLLSSCKPDESVKTRYLLTLSDDVLEYLEPVVTYTTPSEGTKTVTLTKEMMSEGALDIPGEFDTTEAVIEANGTYSWYPELSVYDNADNVTSNITVTFRKKKDVPNEDREYNFLASLGWWYEVQREESGVILTTQRQKLPSFASTKREHKSFADRINALTESELSFTLEVTKDKVKTQDNSTIIFLY